MKNNKLVYVVCPDRERPIGGVKQLYRIVDILNLNGYEAYIAHSKKNFRVTWFENQTPIRYFPNLFAQLSFHKRKKRKIKIPLSLRQAFINKRMPEADSIIIFPEIYGPNINKLVPDSKIVIFNQNCYYSFNNFKALTHEESAYSHPNTLGCIVVSKDSLQYLEYTFPRLNIARIRLGLSKCFQYSEFKKKQIAFMPRKLSEDSSQLFHILSNRMNLAGWQFVAIDKMDEFEVARVLKDSAIFLSFNYREGFGLPPVEAMACGCYVIGYTGNGGEEYFNDDFSSAIADGNIVAFAKEIERIMDIYNNTPDKIIMKGRLASEYVLNTYNTDHETEDITTAWNQILENNRE